jgi:hypothetical protein
MGDIITRGKKGSFDMPVWLIWSLIALIVVLGVIGLSSGKMNEFLSVIGNLFKPS